MGVSISVLADLVMKCTIQFIARTDLILRVRMPCGHIAAVLSVVDTSTVNSSIDGLRSGG